MWSRQKGHRLGSTPVFVAGVVQVTANVRYRPSQKKETHRHTLTHSLTHARTHSLTHSRSHALTHSLTHARTHSLTHARTHSLTHALTHSRTHSLTHALTHSLTHSLTHALTHSRTHSLTHSVTHPDLKRILEVPAVKSARDRNWGGEERHPLLLSSPCLSRSNKNISLVARLPFGVMIIWSKTVRSLGSGSGYD